MSLVARNLDTGAGIADRVDVADTRATRAVGLLSRDRLEPELRDGALDASGTLVGHRIELAQAQAGESLK